MNSLYVARLSPEQKHELQQRLLETQGGRCFICGHELDLELHAGSMDIDHVEPFSGGGKDDPSNFALTHASCNRSKQASDLRVARVLWRFKELRDKCTLENRGPSLKDVLRVHGGSLHTVAFSLQDSRVSYSFPEVGQNEIIRSPLYRDALSGMTYFFGLFPIQYLYHDDKINPRPIGPNVAGLVDEFHKGRPQLHVSLGWVVVGNDPVPIHIFDGQHKAAAQILLGIKRLPVRVFVNPDMDVLLTANTHAGTTLRQVAFDKSVQRHLGSSLYFDRVSRFQADRGLNQDDFTFSERDLVAHFKGESKEMKRYILDAVRDSITHDPENRLRPFVDFGGRGREKPLSYSSIEKTFYSFFIFQDLLDTPLDRGLEVGENPRELEKSQILKLMNLIADELYIARFDQAIGTHRIENRVESGELIPEDHLRAFRLGKEEILYNWLRYVRQIAQNYFILLGTPIKEERLFQYIFPDQLWDRLAAFVKNLRKLPLWANTSLALTVFGGKQNYDFWQRIFESGKTPQGQQVLPEPLNLMEMVKE